MLVPGSVTVPPSRAVVSVILVAALFATACALIGTLVASFKPLQFTQVHSAWGLAAVASTAGEGRFALFNESRHAFALVSGAE